MPSGYTSKVYNGEQTEMNDFIITCARAFGALIDMKEESLTTPIPKKFEPNSYYITSLKEAKENLACVLTMSLEEAEMKANEEYNETVKRNKEYYEEKLETKSRYETMLNKVKMWSPPTPDHLNLKEFCIRQLEDGIQFDCGSLEHYKPENVVRTTGEEWLKNKIEQYQKDVSYHTKQWEDEVKRVKERNKWVQELRENLYENN